MTTTNPPGVYAAIAAVMADMSRDGIAKDRRNQQQGYNFRGIDDVYNALSSSLSRHGLVMLPTVETREQSEGQTKAGGTLFYVVCRVRFDLVCAADGSSHTITTYGEAMDSADKATNKAMSAAYKYAAMQAFCIPTEGDNDADAHTPEPAPRQRPPAQQQARTPAPTPAPKADATPAPNPVDAVLADLAAHGWTRDAATAYGCRNLADLRALLARARATGHAGTITKRIASRITDAQAAGILPAIVETFGAPATWGDGDVSDVHARLDKIKAQIVAATGGN